MALSIANEEIPSGSSILMGILRARALPHFEYDPVLVDLVKIFRIVATIINQKLPRRKAFLVFSGHDFGTPDRK